MSDVLTRQDLQMGYNDLLVIPAGATNIKIAEVTPTPLPFPEHFTVYLGMLVSFACTIRDGRRGRRGNSRCGCVNVHVFTLKIKGFPALDVRVTAPYRGHT